MRPAESSLPGNFFPEFPLPASLELGVSQRAIGYSPRFSSPWRDACRRGTQGCPTASVNLGLDGLTPSAYWPPTQNARARSQGAPVRPHPPVSTGRAACRRIAHGDLAAWSRDDCLFLQPQLSANLIAGLDVRHVRQSVDRRLAAA